MQRSLVARYYIISVLVLSALVAISLIWNLDNLDRQDVRLATAEAEANWKKDQAFRQWATLHGGLYVRPNKRTPPNPYLGHLPNRDIKTTKGADLTLMNPAYMMRQMTEEFEDMYGVKGKITGQILLNPRNKADAWELSALKAFDRGAKKVVEQTNIEGAPYLRLMRPMIMKKGCVKCHGHLGFKEGDIRGGVSVSIPLSSYIAAGRGTKQIMLVSHGGVWFSGLFILAFVAFRSRRHEKKDFQAKRDLHNAYDQLEARVDERTHELTDTNTELKSQIAERQRAEIAVIRSEERISAIVENAVDGIITIDNRGIVDSINPAAEKIFGYSASQIIGSSISMLMPTEEARKHDSNISRYLDGGPSNIIGMGREVQGRRKDGELFPMHLAVSEFSLEDKQMFTGIIRDITASKEAEKALYQAKSEAEEASQAKSEFLSSMSHELRSPLNSILGFGQLMALNPDEPLTEEQAEAVDHISKSGKHLLELIDGVLDLAKIEAGSVGVSIEKTSLASALAESQDTLNAMAQARGITFVLPQDMASVPVVLADSTRLRQVLLNLMSNAIKYNRENGTVTILVTKTGDSRVRVGITDVGEGIPKDRQSELFVPFSRLSKESTDIQGTGIGLVICKNLIEAMKGTVGFESEIGKGTTFWFELPIARHTDANDVDQQPADNPLLTLGTSTSVDGKILYVEDNPDNLELMRKIVSRVRGLSMISSHTAELGIQMAKDMQPGVIILDINLPGMSGLQAVKLLTTDAATKDIPVIALSAAATKRDIENGLEAGFVEYLTKPLNVVEVIEAIRSALKLS
ncbi:MAG: PAS domain S-box protein [Alphaproteobacteria bacterium]|jgi:PAS domain S-box-containing protein|nr:PAS domain S-box protein [Alphaproteobacteria bacterium]MBT5162120.1 PAS domain S-box protein [Alphaproteobacteria bacterium]MBT5919404.1 PAS domain S-box protein [Alphaproteobacteria bacterium]MBT6386262.1 PAS domain S-box protein [Alphaproteobacteria bacterium]